MIDLNEKKIKKIAVESKSIREVGRKLNISRTAVKRKIEKFKIDISHFWNGSIYERMIDKKYGMLTVVSLYKEGRRIFAKCKCDCGKEKNTRCDNLKSGRTISCNCHSKNRWNMVCGKNPAFQGVGELRKAKFSEIKYGAKSRNLEFNVNMKYLWDLYLSQKRRCALTGLPISFGRVHNRSETTASLDRIDNDKGYIKNNVRWVLKDINMIRRKYNTEYFINLCNAVARQHPRNINTVIYIP